MKESNTSEIKVIINADDFGYSHNVNACILEAITQNRISSATIMANGPAVAEALDMAFRQPQVSFGVHLNLTEFSPLLPSRNHQSVGLVDGDGNFLGNGFRQLRPSPRLLEACYQELDQQILSLSEKGLQPSHLDSHHHIHTIPWLMPVVWKLQKKYQIFRMRNTLNVYPSPRGDSSRLRLLAAKKMWETASVLLGSRMTQRFSSLHVFLADPFRAEFLSASSIELMCHPGQDGFEAETDQLLTKGQSLLPQGFCLANYLETIIG
jgi:predicted glycoside hydrolase/deacetylase ChbG (UPF0249 family)